jgi:hypothetical protein
MPNQLAKNKRRQSLAEHEAVLAALAAVARREKTTVMALLRQAVRETVRQKSADPRIAAEVRRVVEERAPRLPSRFTTPAEVARFKREQRAFDQVLIDLALANPIDVQQRNSLVRSRESLRLVDFHLAHANSR